ncbi:hypothetical protein KJ654_02125 [Patescibacteria group bacterium]|nr:hypothetical protein [Patescibacteria group bacterium]
MTNKSDFLDALRLLVGRAELEDSERERMLALLTEGQFGTIELDELNKIASIVESEKANLEREILESSNPDLINEMSDTVEALEQIEYDSATKTFEELSASDNLNSAKNISGQSLLDKFAGIQ